MRSDVQVLWNSAGKIIKAKIQFDCNDENSILQISLRQIEKFIKDLNEIERWNK